MLWDSFWEVNLTARLHLGGSTAYIFESGSFVLGEVVRAIMRSLLLSLVPLTAPAAQPSDDFWQQPFDQWNREQVLRMLGNSPWTRSQTLTSAVRDKEPRAAGEKQLNYSFSVSRFCIVQSPLR